MKKTTAFTTILISLLLAAPALADDVIFTPSVTIPGSDFQAGQNVVVTGATKTICDYIIAYYQYGIGILAVLAVIVIAVAGLSWVMSGGNPGKINKAKSRITDAIFGIAVALFSFVILSTINKELVICKNFTLPTVAKLEAELNGMDTYNPNRANFNKNIDTYDDLLKDAASQYGVDCTLLKAHMIAESGGVPNLTSGRGAIGLLQLMPGTARNMGCGSNLYDPKTSIDCGAKYIKYLEQNCCNGKASNSVCTNQDVKYRIAAYNAGPGANIPSADCKNMTIWECTINPGGYVETQRYVEKVKANFNKLQTNGWGC